MGHADHLVLLSAPFQGSHAQGRAGVDFCRRCSLGSPDGWCPSVSPVGGRRTRLESRGRIGERGYEGGRSLLFCFCFWVLSGKKGWLCKAAVFSRSSSSRSDGWLIAHDCWVRASEVSVGGVGGVVLAPIAGAVAALSLDGFRVGRECAHARC